MLTSLIAATVAVVMARQFRPEHLVLISLSIGAAGFAAGALYRALLPLVSPEDAGVDEPLPETLRAVLEREKMLALRAIKELEFDRAMGKVSEKDFADMGGRLRARAARLMRQLDAGSGYRSEIEKEIVKRIGEAPVQAHGGSTEQVVAGAVVIEAGAVVLAAGELERGWWRPPRWGRWPRRARRHRRWLPGRRRR